MTMPPPYQPPVAPRRSSALPWVIVAVVAVLVVGGLVALFALRGTGGGTPTPTPSPSPSATTGTSTAPADWLTEDQYPSEVKGWTMRWDDGLPDYNRGPRFHDTADDETIGGGDKAQIGPLANERRAFRARAPAVLRCGGEIGPRRRRPGCRHLQFLASRVDRRIGDPAAVEQMFGSLRLGSC